MVAEAPILETGFSLSDAVPSPPDRRRDERYLTILRVGILIVDGRRELCLIRNISAGGLMAHVYSPVREDQRVTVELKSNQQLHGSIAWVRDAEIGIGFESQVDVAELLATPQDLGHGRRPRIPRVEIDRLATLRSGARTYRVQVRDISQGGVKIETDQAFESDSEVVLTLQHFRPVAATVRWQAGRACGVAFNELIPFEELIGLLKRRG